MMPTSAPLIEWILDLSAWWSEVEVKSYNSAIVFLRVSWQAGEAVDDDLSGFSIFNFSFGE